MNNLKELFGSSNEELVKQDIELFLNFGLDEKSLTLYYLSFTFLFMY